MELRRLVVLGATFTLAANNYAQTAQTHSFGAAHIEYGSQVSNESHPDIDLAQTQLRAAQIRLNQLESTYGFDAFVELQPRVASRASNPGVDFQNDSRYR